MENLQKQNLRIVPFKPHSSHKLEWKKYKGEHQEELFVTITTEHGEFTCNVGYIQEIHRRNTVDENDRSKHRIVYQGICCRLGISSGCGHPDYVEDINIAKKWVEENYGIYCKQTEKEIFDH